MRARGHHTPGMAVAALSAPGLTAAPSGARQVVLNVGPAAAGVAIALCLAAGATTLSADVPEAALVLAGIALAVGIPHGAVDHLALGRTLTPRQRLLGGAAYLAVAALAAALILRWPAATFAIVLACTVWHFGSGDVEAERELSGLPAERGPLRIAHAIAAGAAPVLLPLTSPTAVSTLEAINPALVSWLPPAAFQTVRIAILLLVVCVFLALLQRERPRAAISLAILALLGLIATPLVAFAVYFAGWHALRHTARLAEDSRHGITGRGVGMVFAAGIPALVGTVLAVAVIVAVEGTSGMPAWLWTGLAVVWGLTVPHMLVVAAFDRRRREGANASRGVPE